MKDIATRFFATGAVFALGGMVWGIIMSATQDHTLSPAHGHLNLIGFVIMSVFGTYYALSPAAAASKLAGIHYWLTLLSVILIVPGIVMALSGSGETLAKIGSALSLAAMTLFVFVVIRHRVENRPLRETV